MTKLRANEAKWDEKNQRWVIKVQRDGRRKSFYSSTPGTRGKAEAERKADVWLENCCREQAKDITFDELTVLYLAHIRTGNGTAHKSKEDSVIRTHLLPRWTGRKISRLTNIDYQEAIDACVEGREHPLSARTCGHVRSTITALWHYARRARLPMEEPIDLTIPSGATKKSRTILQPDDIRKLFDPALDKYFYVPAFRFIVLTGLRRGELCGLRTEDIDGSVLTTRRAVNSAGEITNGKNENALRTIVLPQLALDAIELHRSHLKQKGIISPWVFCNTRGEQMPPHGLYSRWLYFREKYGLASASLHELRHTMVSVCKDDLPLPLLKQVVGHSMSMDTLGQYGHSVDGERERVAALIGSIYDDLLHPQPATPKE